MIMPSDYPKKQNEQEDHTSNLIVNEYLKAIKEEVTKICKKFVFQKEEGEEEGKAQPNTQNGKQK